jgi:hypothetical protein
MENPGLCIRRSVLVDRKRTPSGHFLHQFHTEVESLELGSQIETQCRLAYTVRSDKRNFSPAPADCIEGKKVAGSCHGSKECSARRI